MMDSLKGYKTARRKYDNAKRKRSKYIYDPTKYLCLIYYEL